MSELETARLFPGPAACSAVRDYLTVSEYDVCVTGKLAGGSGEPCRVRAEPSLSPERVIGGHFGAGGATEVERSSYVFSWQRLVEDGGCKALHGLQVAYKWNRKSFKFPHLFISSSLHLLIDRLHGSFACHTTALTEILQRCRSTTTYTSRKPRTSPAKTLPMKQLLASAITRLCRGLPRVQPPIRNPMALQSLNYSSP